MGIINTDVATGVNASLISSGRKLIEDSSGNIYVVYTKGSLSNIYISKSTDYGVTWTETQLSTETTYNQIEPTIAIYDTNKIIVVWEGKHSGSTSYTQIRYIVFDGSTWGSVLNMTTSSDGHQTNPVLSFDGINTQLIWSGITATTYSQVRHSFWNSFVWASITDITSNASAIIYQAPSITTLGTVIHVVFAQSDGDGITYWKYNGSSWGASVAWTEGNDTEQTPCITMLVNDPVVVWIDTDYLLGGFYATLYKSYNGSSWDATVAIEDSAYTGTENVSIGIEDGNPLVLASFQETNTQVEHLTKISGAWTGLTEITISAFDKTNISIIEQSSTYLNKGFIYVSNSILKYFGDSVGVLQPSGTELNLEKKLQYVSHTFQSDYINEEFPTWQLFLNAFAEYLDQSLYDYSTNLTDNLDYNKIYSQLLDSFVTQYFGAFIDSNKYSLTDANKKHFLSISKMIAGMKGNKESFDFLFKYLKNINVTDTEGGSTSVNEYNIIYNEDESWWDIVTHFYDGTYLYDGSITYSGTESALQYTYEFTIDDNQAVIESLLDTLHPLGLFYIFNRLMTYTEDVSCGDSLTITIT